MWLGHLYLAVAYWMPALLARDAASNRFESWLIRTEEKWNRIRVGPPGWLVGAVELSYLLCYAVVPAAFLVMWLNGSAAGVNQFWSAVLVAGFISYGSLPWLISRPPRIVEQTTPSGIGRANVFVLSRVSHGLNTFPSGHVAVSMAAAVEVYELVPVAGALLIVIATAIAAGAVAGRYHYAVDVFLGLAVGIAAAATL